MFQIGLRARPALRIWQHIQRNDATAARVCPQRQQLWRVHANVARHENFHLLERIDR